MRKYAFYDADIYYRTFGEYDICGEDYADLIKKCAKYCTTFSLRISDLDIHIPRELEKYRIPLHENAEKLFGDYYCYDEIRDYPQIVSELGLDRLSLEKCVLLYRVTDESLKALFLIADSIFNLRISWEYRRPEDLTFYREDGSVFFTSSTHDGYCELTARDDEDVSNIISKGYWIYHGNNGEPYDITLMSFCDMEKLQGEKAIKMGAVNRLVLTFQNLKREVMEHLHNFEDIHLHLIFGDIFNPFMFSLLDGTHPNYELISLGYFIEHLLNMDEYIQEVVVTTVLERLSDDPEKFELFSQFAGKQAKRFIEEMLQ